jgi:hypothetical protein
VISEVAQQAESVLNDVSFEPLKDCLLKVDVMGRLLNLCVPTAQSTSQSSSRS